MLAASAHGLSYLGDYDLDLTQVFPVSLETMSPALLAIEVLGTVISFLLMALPIQVLQEVKSRQFTASAFHSSDTKLSWRTPQVFMISSLDLIALGIIGFSTRSAIGL